MHAEGHPILSIISPSFIYLSIYTFAVPCWSHKQDITGSKVLPFFSLHDTFMCKWLKTNCRPFMWILPSFINSSLECGGAITNKECCELTVNSLVNATIELSILL